jgi:3-phosphoshikimate 1-carboxyvinyltransferase
LELFFKGKIVRPKFFSVRVLHWPDSDWQVDQRFPATLPEPPDFNGVVSRATDLGDSIMTAMILAPFAHNACNFTELTRLRVQETERVAAMENELKKCGAKAEDHGKRIALGVDSVLATEQGVPIESEQIDTLTVYPSELHGAEIETYDDHRMAMCFAILGLKVPGIKIKNPACVKKTFPNFFQKLAAAPPHGLGATIRDAKTGRKLEEAELFAD